MTTRKELYREQQRFEMLDFLTATPRRFMTMSKYNQNPGASYDTITFVEGLPHKFNTLETYLKFHKRRPSFCSVKNLRPMWDDTGRFV